MADKVQSKSTPLAAVIKTHGSLSNLIKIYMTAQVISSINMKGGVGKTALTVNLAASLAHNYNKRILVVDLDPQTNATFSLITKDHWDKWIHSKLTLADLMSQSEEFNLSRKRPNIEDAIIKNVGGNIKGLDLIPSHLRLTFIDIKLAIVSHREMILKKNLESILNQYDYILCDCPPNLSISTQNGLAASNYYIIPVFPEPLAALGLGLINNKIKELNEYRTGAEIKSLGIVFTKYDLRINETELSASEIAEANSEEYIFRTKIPENVKVKSSVREAKPVILSSPRSRSAIAYKELAKEFLDRIGKV
ncbi:MAG: ParA family protein [Coleofasciculus sp. G1-WW12-02]|uniref:ParA family protein n=1 Tax=Coleofasciculus sp. G1-WW12-02 TaxID=3068483 RepID=UPI0032FA3C83